MDDLRSEEADVLASIYDPDELTISDDYTVTYRVGEHGTLKSLVLTIQWPTGYPDVLPILSLETFYNSHLPSGVKQQIGDDLMSVAKGQLGTPMTFSLIDYLRENFERYLSMMDEDGVDRVSKDVGCSSVSQDGAKRLKKEQLTKTQKRKQANRLGVDGELTRGWNWVSVKKHLQQTG